MILRLPIRIDLYRNGEHVKSFTSTKKSQIRLKLHDLSKNAWNLGVCRVFYNKPNDFWNQFTFTSIAQLEAGLLTVTEKPLVDFLHDEIAPQYLEKRQLTPAQVQALTKARQASTMEVSHG